MNDLVARIARWRRDPVAFIADLFGEAPDDQQAEVLRALPIHARIAVRSGNGCGKTWLATRAALWFFLVHPGAKVIVTAPTWRQLERVFWAELHHGVHRSAIPRWVEFTRTSAALLVRRSGKLVPSESWFIIGLSSDAPENFQGFHGRHIFFIIDEASGVGDEVFDAIEGNRASGNARLLVIGNPTRIAGRFYEIFREEAPGWARFHFTGLKSRWVSSDWIAEKQREWGEDSDLFAIRVLGEFPRASANALFSRDAVESALFPHLSPHQRTPDSPDETPASGTLPDRGAFRFAGVDVARFGNDATVLTVFRQNPDGTVVLEDLQAWRQAPLTVLAEEIARALLLRVPRVVCVDDTGVGGGITDLLKSQRHALLRAHIRPVIFAAAPPENAVPSSARFANTKAALAWRLRTILEDGTLAVSPAIPREVRARIAHQLLGFTYRFTDAGRLIVEDPPGKSPDESHSMMLALAALDRAPAPRFALL